VPTCVPCGARTVSLIRVSVVSTCSGPAVLHFKWTAVLDDGSLIQSTYLHTDCVIDGGSYFQSSEFAKGSVSVSRLRAATMLRPAALEKKMSRIAARCVRGRLFVVCVVAVVGGWECCVSEGWLHAGRAPVCARLCECYLSVCYYCR
jgi:hypothetical protein